MPNLVHSTFAQQHLDDVEADVDGRITQQPQIIERRLRQQSLFAQIDRSRRSNPLFVRARLDFNEDQDFAIAKNEVRLAAAFEVSTHPSLRGNSTR